MAKMYQAYTKWQLEDLKAKLNEALLSESGFIMIYNGDKRRLTDIYHRVCKDCVLKSVKTAVDDYAKTGLFAKCNKKGK
jgi:hypothetical protein